MAALNAPEVEVVWHWRFDPHRMHIGGQALKNEMLDEIDDGWCWALDDDTIAHENVLRVVSQVAAAKVKARAIIVSQLRTSGHVLQARPEQMCVGGVDIGQAFLRRDLIGDQRIPLDYEGDGMFLQAVLAGQPAIYLADVLSLHNSLTGVDVSV